MHNWGWMGGLMLVSSVTWAAQPSLQDLQKVEAELQVERQNQQESQRKADAVKKEMTSVQGQLVSTAQQIQTQEGRLNLLEQRKRELENHEQELLNKLNLSDKQLARVMKGLQTLALRPKELLLVQKKKPVDVFRSRLLMRYSLPVIGYMKSETQKDLEELAQTRVDLLDQWSDIKKAHQNLTDQNVKMNRLLQQKKLMQAQYMSDYEKSKKKAQSLAAQAKDLKDLLARLEKERKEAQKKAQKTERPPVLDGAFGRTYGKLVWPAKGTLKQLFGQESVGGAHAKGIVIQTRPNAQIIIPFDGVVLFAGPFQNYGQLLIVDHGNEYLTVLAGLGHIDVAVGQELLAGEPIGQMGQNYTDLYLEIRHQGQAEDPVPWFQPERRK